MRGKEQFDYKHWIKQFIRILDLHVVIITALALGCTFACLQLNIFAELPLGLLGLAVVFPIVFSINAAYKRREGVLKNYSKFKGMATSIYLAHRDWPHQTANGFATKTHDMLQELDDDMWKMFAGENPAAVYTRFSALSQRNELLRDAGVPANEMSRINQYLKDMIVEFEAMKVVCDYRTPQSLRAYSKFFLNTFPIFFAPHFASLVNESHSLLGYGVAGLYSVVLVCLDNVQDRLEDPFDQHGADDIRLEDKWRALE